ncbi:unnamed protein product, partial [Amoebophrya sp. A25]|eukprot:GSA25T00028039001.1
MSSGTVYLPQRNVSPRMLKVHPFCSCAQYKQEDKGCVSEQEGAYLVFEDGS